MKLSRFLSLSVALSLVLLASIASAQPSKEATPPKTESKQDIVFPDADNLNGDPLGPTGGLIKPRGKPIRGLLLKPRTTFVQQILKNVENL
jgi:hypothetical protein